MTGEPKSVFERDQAGFETDEDAVLDADVDEKDMTDDEREYFERLRSITK